MVKATEPADKAWPTCNIETRGRAKTYSEPEIRLKVLEKCKHAFTEDSDQENADPQPNADNKHLAKASQAKKSLPIRALLNAVPHDLNKIKHKSRRTRQLHQMNHRWRKK